jgi:predicted nucleotidyltransferase
LKLRDRDAIVTKEGLIFRVLGYSHPSNAYICDAEYAPAEIFKSDNPKAFRNRGRRVFFKFYEDEGWKFLRNSFPEYLISHAMLRKKTVGVHHDDIMSVRRPDERLQRLIKRRRCDALLAAMNGVLESVTQHSGLHREAFGTFGSILHGFHNPRFSDIDLTIYGKKNVARLCETLKELYIEDHSQLANEFETDESIKGKHWRFRNLSPKEFVWHQRRKLIYALFNDKNSGRTIKAEFEPVKSWKEINNEYDPKTRIVQKGWVRIIARITGDDDAPFIPSTYEIEPTEVLEGRREANEARRVISYVEEFRMQASKDEKVYLEGNLEEFGTAKRNSYQITLTVCPRYYEQVLKVTSAV